MKQPNIGYADVKLDFACMHPAGSLYVTTTISVVFVHSNFIKKFFSEGLVRNGTLSFEFVKGSL